MPRTTRQERIKKRLRREAAAPEPEETMSKDTQLLSVILIREMEAASSEEDLRNRLLAALRPDAPTTASVEREQAIDDAMRALARAFAMPEGPNPRNVIGTADAFEIGLKAYDAVIGDTSILIRGQPARAVFKAELRKAIDGCVSKKLAEMMRGLS